MAERPLLAMFRLDLRVLHSFLLPAAGFTVLAAFAYATLGLGLALVTVMFIPLMAISLLAQAEESAHLPRLQACLPVSARIVAAAHHLVTVAVLGYATVAALSLVMVDARLRDIGAGAGTTGAMLLLLLVGAASSLFWPVADRYGTDRAWWVAVPAVVLLLAIQAVLMAQHWLSFRGGAVLPRWEVLRPLWSPSVLVPSVVGAVLLALWASYRRCVILRCGTRSDAPWSSAVLCRDRSGGCLSGLPWSPVLRLQLLALRELRPVVALLLIPTVLAAVAVDALSSTLFLVPLALTVSLNVVHLAGGTGLGRLYDALPVGRREVVAAQYLVVSGVVAVVTAVLAVLVGFDLFRGRGSGTDALLGVAAVAVALSAVLGLAIPLSTRWGAWRGVMAVLATVMLLTTGLIAVAFTAPDAWADTKFLLAQAPWWGTLSASVSVAAVALTSSYGVTTRIYERQDL
ncbi:ABC-2 transporter permease [Austwickia chelonae]|uniref:ABC-2 transporter permease n=1 Tax=Austwickia chelonae TaxID=100225 RepID=UPI0013C2A79D|nr:ABC-2 transporter permease [Austwickia chelonae]